MSVIAGQVIVAASAQGPVIALDEPLSFWGGFDSETGIVIDEHHPQVGARLTDAVVVMATGRGSSSASSVLLEAARLGTAPAALVLLSSDEIIATGAIVAQELYGRPVPILLVGAADYAAVAAASNAAISPSGEITLASSGSG